MNQYKTGTYHIRLFDKYGTRIRPDARPSEDNLHSCIQTGDEILQKDENVGSFVILRVIHNSLDG